MSATTPHRRQRPTAPLPDFRRIFLEPVFSHQALAGMDEPGQEEYGAAESER